MITGTVHTIKPLRRISPSRYTILSRCPYRVVLANTYKNPLLPYSPESHLGNIIHKCIRRIVSNEISTISEFDNSWSSLLATEEKTLADIGFGFLVPLSESASGYTIKKLQVRNMILHRINVKNPGSRITASRILSEEWLESQDSLIGGYADIIITKGSFTKLSDYKSGKILDDEGEIKQEYEEQIKLYAYLHHQVFGKYPDELSVIDLDKKEYYIDFTIHECEMLAVEAKKYLHNINNLIEKGATEKLAKPTIDKCKLCLFRPACEYFWSISSPKTNSKYFDVRGSVHAVRQFNNGNINVTLNYDEGEMIISHIKGEQLSSLQGFIGKDLAFYNLRQCEVQNRYQAIRTTKIYE